MKEIRCSVSAFMCELLKLGFKRKSANKLSKFMFNVIRNRTSFINSSSKKLIYELDNKLHAAPTNRLTIHMRSLTALLKDYSKNDTGLGILATESIGIMVRSICIFSLELDESLFRRRMISRIYRENSRSWIGK